MNCQFVSCAIQTTTNSILVVLVYSGDGHKTWAPVNHNAIQYSSPAANTTFVKPEMLDLIETDREVLMELLS